MSDTLLLERTTVPQRDLLASAAAFTKAVTNPFHATFEVKVTPRHEWRPEVLHVFMHAGGKRMRVDDIAVTALQLQTDDKAAAVRDAYTEAYDALTVTFQKSSRRQMAGWVVSGGEDRFVLDHKKKEVLQHMAYIAGKDARDLLGMGDHHPTNVSRAQMIFKY